MNLELADSYGGPVWLHANAASEGISLIYVIPSLIFYRRSSST